MLKSNMIKYGALIILALLSSGCVNKHGISAKVYSDCDEYYDMQGYYHKKCGDDDIITYNTLGKEIKKSAKKVKSLFMKEKPVVQKNVW
jgi:hypothetical protein